MAAVELDLEVVFDRFLGDGDSLERVYEILVRHAPEWSEQLRVYRSARDQERLEHSPDVFRDAVLKVAGERGETYRALVARHGSGDERLFGKVELRGATPDLTVVIAVDERAVTPRGDALVLPNDVTFQLRRARVQGQPAATWANVVLEEIAASTTPVWGAISAGSEYDAKVMSDGPGFAAIGRDFGRFLPGLFSVNFFGPPYVDLIGRRRLLDAPGAREVGEGVLITVADDPRQWDAPAHREREDAVLDHLGREYFFSKTAMPSLTKAPDWSAQARG